MSDIPSVQGSASPASPATVPPLPWRTNYGPFVRIVEPDRHIFVTTFDYRRWMIGLGSIGGVVLGIWATLIFWPFVIGPILSIFTGLITLGMLGCLYMVLVVRTYVEVNRRFLLFSRRDLFGRSTRRSWPVTSLDRVKVGEFPSFHIGGVSYGSTLTLFFFDGDVQPLFVTFDTEAPAAWMATDIAFAAQIMAESTTTS